MFGRYRRLSEALQTQSGRRAINTRTTESNKCSSCLLLPWNVWISAHLVASGCAYQVNTPVQTGSGEKQWHSYLQPLQRVPRRSHVWWGGCVIACAESKVSRNMCVLSHHQPPVCAESGEICSQVNQEMTHQSRRCSSSSAPTHILSLFSLFLCLTHSILLLLLFLKVGTPSSFWSFVLGSEGGTQDGCSGSCLSGVVLAKTMVFKLWPSSGKRGDRWLWSFQQPRLEVWPPVHGAPHWWNPRNVCQPLVCVSLYSLLTTLFSNCRLLRGFFSHQQFIFLCEL